MAAFWLGTVPVMAVLGLSARALSARLGARLPIATALLMVALGLWTVAGRLAMPAMAAAPIDLTADATSTTPSCCEADEH
jgi:sulfite exporter TauE/SafE